MTAAEALEFFTAERKLRAILQDVADVALDYLRLGQPLTTLSGVRASASSGHAPAPQGVGVRVGRADHRPAHVRRWPALAVLDGLVDRGNTVIVVEHDLGVIRRADWDPTAAATAATSCSRARPPSCCA